MTLGWQTLRFLTRRSASQWVLFVLLLTVAVSTVTFASGIIVYFNGLSNLALQRYLEGRSNSGLDILLRYSVAPLSIATQAQTAGEVNLQLGQTLKKVTSQHTSALRSDTLFLQPSDTASDAQTRGKIAGVFVALDGFAQHSSLVAGSWPSEAPVRTSGPQFVEVAVPEEAATAWHLTIGEHLGASASWNAGLAPVPVVVSAIFERTKPSDPFWTVYDQGLFPDGVSSSEVVMVVSQATFAPVLSNFLPDMAEHVGQWFQIDVRRISTPDIDPIVSHLQSAKTRLDQSVSDYQQVTRLGETLSAFDDTLAFSKPPMFVIGSVVIVMSIYLVGLISALISDSRSDEITKLRSRGATSNQVVVVFVAESLVLLGVSIGIGPYLAKYGVAALSNLGTIGRITGPLGFPATLDAEAYMAAAATGVVAACALIIPGYRKCKDLVVAGRRSRSRPIIGSAFQKYYADVVLLGIGLLLMRELVDQHSAVSRGLIGSAQTNYVALAAPALFLLGSGIVAMRILPWVAGALTKAGKKTRASVPLLLELALLSIARNPRRHVRLTVILVVVAGLAIMTADFSATLLSANHDQTFYESGADIRATGLSNPDPTVYEDVISSLTHQSGVEAVSPVLREQASIVGVGSVGTYEIAGIDPRTFSSVGWLRPDFATNDPKAVLGALNATAPSLGLEIPEGARWLSVEVRPRTSHPELRMVAQVVDARGHVYSITLGTLLPLSAAGGAEFQCGIATQGERPGWCRVGADLEILRSRFPTIKSPLHVVFLGVGQATRSANLARSGEMEIADLSSFDQGMTHESSLETFANLSSRLNEGWFASFGSKIQSATNTVGAPSRNVATLQWAVPQPGQLNGVALGPPAEPYSVVASPEFLTESGTRVGSTVHLWVAGHEIPVKVMGTLDYFPTIDPETSPFLITDIQSLWSIADLREFDPSVPVSELWISGSETTSTVASIGSTLSTLGVGTDRIATRNQLLSAHRLDVLGPAGWDILLWAAFIATLTFATLGFLVHIHLLLSERRGEFATIRVLGSSSRALAVMVLLEEAIVVVAASLVGIFAGQELASRMVPFVLTGVNGAAAVPPVITLTAWDTLGTLFGIEAVLLLTIIAYSVMWARHMSISSVLRGGGE